MKTMLKIFSLTGAIFLSACASTESLTCPSVSATLTAKDDGKNGSGRSASFIRVRPDTVVVRQNCPFVLNNPGGHEVTITSAAAWLNKPATTDARISVGPATSTIGNVVKYTITVTDIGMLDPRARIVR